MNTAYLRTELATLKSTLKEATDCLKMTLDMHLKGVTDVEIARRQDVTPNVVSGRIRLGKVKLMKDSELKKVWDELKQRGRR